MFHASKNGIKSERTKHVAIKYAFIHDEVSSERVTLKWIPTTEQLADIFTKSLSRPLHEVLRAQLMTAVVPPQPRLVGVEPNPGPCGCGGKAGGRIGCCQGNQCTCVVAGTPCVPACMCHGFIGKFNHVCFNSPDPNTGALRPAITAQERARREIDQGELFTWAHHQVTSRQLGNRFVIVTMDSLLNWANYIVSILPPAVIAAGEDVITAAASVIMDNVRDGL